MGAVKYCPGTKWILQTCSCPGTLSGHCETPVLILIKGSDNYIVSEINDCVEAKQT